jgi:hypothetical protein
MATSGTRHEGSDWMFSWSGFTEPLSFKFLTASFSSILLDYIDFNQFV